MVKRLLLAALGWLIACGAAHAVCVTPLTGNDAGGVTRQFLTVLDASSNCIGTTIIVDGTAGANKTAVKAASTAAVATDPALVVAVSPNNTVGVTQATAANLNATVVGPSATGAALAGNPVRVGLSDGTNAQNWLTALTLGDGVNGNNTGAVAPWVWNGATWDRMPGTAAGGVKVAPGAIATWGLFASSQNVTSPTNALLIGGEFNTTPTTITTGNSSPLQLDSAGNLLVNVKAGGASGGTSSTFGAAFPGTGTAIGLTSGTNMVAWSATTNYGSAPAAIAVPAVNAFVTNTNANGANTAANSSPVTMAVDQGASTTGNIVANNTTAVVVNAAATTLYSVQLGGIGSAPAYLKLYNATSATCGSGTPVKRLIIPAAPTAANGAGSNVTFPLGLRFSTGLTYCVTTGIGDADTTAPAASTFLVNLDWR